MEIRHGLLKKMSELFLEPVKPFSRKRDFNKKRIAKCFGIILVIILVGVLLMPSTQQIELDTFSEKKEASQSEATSPVAGDASVDPLLSISNLRDTFGAPRIPSFSGAYSGGQSEADGVSQNRNTPMILVREGFDSKTQLQPGTRVELSISDRILVGPNAMPIRGRVLSDVTQDSGVAIPENSVLIGDVSFDEYSDRANISWKSLIFPDGKQRDFAAVGASPDGEAGVEGRIHSEAVKNTIGQAMTRFVGSYAEGAISRNQTGESSGGSDNGWKTAFAETAKERADIWAQNLKKIKRWIEVPAGTKAIAIITQPFRFRDPGSVR